MRELHMFISFPLDRFQIWNRLRSLSLTWSPTSATTLSALPRVSSPPRGLSISSRMMGKWWFSRWARGRGRKQNYLLEAELSPVATWVSHNWGEPHDRLCLCGKAEGMCKFWGNLFKDTGEKGKSIRCGGAEIAGNMKSALNLKEGGKNTQKS